MLFETHLIALVIKYSRACLTDNARADIFATGNVNRHCRSGRCMAEVLVEENLRRPLYHAADRIDRQGYPRPLEMSTPDGTFARTADRGAFHRRAPRCRGSDKEHDGHGREPDQG